MQIFKSGLHGNKSFLSVFSLFFHFLAALFVPVLRLLILEAQTVPL